MSKTARLIISCLVLIASSSTSLAGGPNHPEDAPANQNRHDKHQLYMEPNPIERCNLETILTFHFRGSDFDIAEVDLETVKILGKIPSYTGPVRREGDWLVTDCLVFRFLGTGGFVPWLDDFTATYTIEFDLLSGEHVVLEDQFSAIAQIKGDLNCDLVVTIEDLVILTDCLYSGWCEVSSYEADIDRDGDVDQDDLEALVCIIYGGC